MAVRRRVIDHLDQAADPAVNKGAVADHADDAPALILGQNVAQPEPHPKTCPHANTRINRLKWLQDPQRITADVTRHDAVSLAQGVKHNAVLAGVTQLRRAAGRLRCFRAEIVIEDPSHAGNIQFAEAIHLILAFDLDALGADGVHQIRIAFFNDHAALDGSRK